jgi:hypothetical protein
MNCRVCNTGITKNILLKDLPPSISILHDLENQELKTYDKDIYMYTNCGYCQIKYKYLKAS